MHRWSNGVFDIAVASTLQGMDLLPRLSADVPVGTDALSFDAIELLADQSVRFRHANVRVDLGGIAKGFAVDRALEVLRGSGAASGLVNAGGDLAVFGEASQTVHIRHPRDPRRLICSVEVTDEALASSARRFRPLSIGRHDRFGGHRSKHQQTIPCHRRRYGARASLHAGRRADENYHDFRDRRTRIA